MGGKTAMVTALCQPDVVDKLVVVDVSPHESPGTGETEDLIGALKQLDLHSLRDRREADLILSDRIPVRFIPPSFHCHAFVAAVLITAYGTSMITNQYTH